MRKRGVSEGSAVTFFLGNSTLNPAMLVFLLFALGWQWAALRLVLGSALVLRAALVAVRLTTRALAAEVMLPETQIPAADEGFWAVRWLRALLRLTVSLIPEYIVIVLLLGAARGFLFPAIGMTHGNEIVVLIGRAIAGTLFVIPTAGEIPVIQTLMAYGLRAGPAGALLLTLAPLSLPSLVMVARVFPRRVLLALVGLVIAAGIVGGIIAIALLLGF